MANRTERMVIHRMEDQGDRIVLYPAPEDGGYHVLAPIGQTFRVGETVEYEPYGVNFGWFVRRCNA